MSEVLHYFGTPQVDHVVALPFDLDAVLQDWGALQKRMVKAVHPAFSRDEWAYLATFLCHDNLALPFVQSFGDVATPNEQFSGLLFRPRGKVAVWLPNNVSLLGPLTLVLLSLSGNPLQIKAGSRAGNLAAPFLDYCLEHLPAGDLKAHLEERVTVETFSAADSRHRDMASTAQIRIFFGSDEIAAQVEQLEHPVNSFGIYFVDKWSEVWLDGELATDETLKDLVKVFAVFGQTGCTSPKRVVLIRGDRASSRRLMERVAKVYSSLISHPPAMATAAENVMTSQLATALGWSTRLLPLHSAVLATGSLELPVPAGSMFLPVSWGTLEEAFAALPENAQSLGLQLKCGSTQEMLQRLAKTSIKRVVPVRDLHNFGHVWDGFGFWRMLFEEIHLSFKVPQQNLWVTSG